MKLALSGKRVIGYGENLIPMGGTVIDTDTNKVYQNATIAECDGCPSDIDLVGYEYHAGNFVPCAPYGTEDSGGEIMVACDNCATPRKSGVDIQDVHDASKLSRGTLSSDRLPTVPVAKGGTGRSTLTADSFLVGNATGTVKLLTPTDVLTKIGAAPTSHAFSSHYLGDVSNTDFNTVKTSGLYYGYTGMTNAAFQSICVLEVIAYSKDWVVQRQTKINGEPITYERHYHSGNTWSEWIEKPTSKTLIMRDSTGSKYNVLYTMLHTQEQLVLGPNESTFYTVLRGGIMDIRSGKEIRLFPYYGESGSTYGHVVIGAQGTERGVEVRPSSDSIGSLGYSGCRWKYMYSVNGVSTSSDARLKENISDDLSVVLEALSRLRPVSYEYSDIKDGKIRFGFVAQEVEETFNELGLDPTKYAFLQKDAIDPESDMAKFIGDTTVYSLNYSELIAPNIAMIQKQQAEIEDLKSENNTLKSEIAKIKEHLGIS